MAHQRRSNKHSDKRSSKHSSASGSSKRGASYFWTGLRTSGLWTGGLWTDNVPLCAGILAIMSFALYAQTIGYGYVLDDSIVLSANKYVQAGFAGLWDIFSKETWAGNVTAADDVELSGGRYRPLSLALFACLWEFFGDKPAVYHLANVVLNAAVVVVVFLTLHLCLRGAESLPQHGAASHPALPLFAALLFAAHPIHTEVVANIKSCDELLCLLFSMLAVYYFVRFHQEQPYQDQVRQDQAVEHDSPQKPSRPYRFLLLSCLMLSVALFAKETAIPFAFIIPLTAFTFTRASLRQILLTTLPIVAVVVAFLLLRTSIAGFLDSRAAPDVLNNPFLRASVSEKYATIVMVLGRYLVSAAYPLVMSYEYGYNQIPIVGWSDWRVMVSLVAYTALVVFAVWKLRERNLVAYGIWVALAAISIVSNIVFDLGGIMADRFLYVPTLGTTLITALGCIAVAHRSTLASSSREQSALNAPPVSMPWRLGWQWQGNRLMYGLVLAVAGVYALRTITRNPAWESQFTLRTTDVQNAPNSVKAQAAASAVYMLEAAKYTGAEKEAFMDKGRYHLEQALKIDSNAGAFVWANLGVYYSDYRKYDSALMCFDRALRLDSNHRSALASLYSTKGMMAIDANQFDSALVFYRKSLSYYSQNVTNQYNVGVALYKMRRLPEALAEFRKALAMDANYQQAQLGVQVCLQEMQQQQAQPQPK
jgi:Tfp pilus assembly protein PilF